LTLAFIIILQKNEGLTIDFLRVLKNREIAQAVGNGVNLANFKKKRLLLLVMLKTKMPKSYFNVRTPLCFWRRGKR